jgi:hypothetical protein
MSLKLDSNTSRKETLSTKSINNKRLAKKSGVAAVEMFQDVL